MNIVIYILRTTNCMPLTRDELIYEAKIRFKAFCKRYRLILREQVFILIYKNNNFVNRVNYYVAGRQFTVQEVRSYGNLIKILDEL